MANVYLTIGGIALAALFGFLSAAFWWQRTERRDKAARIAEGHDKLQARVADLENKLGLVSQAVVPISTAFQAILIKELTHYHTPVVDALLVKLGPPYTLTAAEETELILALKQREADMGELISDAERDAAHILPAVMKRARHEALLGESTVRFRLVTVALDVPEAEPTRPQP